MFVIAAVIIVLVETAAQCSKYAGEGITEVLMPARNGKLFGRASTLETNEIKNKF